MADTVIFNQFFNYLMITDSDVVNWSLVFEIRGMWREDNCCYNGRYDGRKFDFFRIGFSGAD